MLSMNREMLLRCEIELRISYYISRTYRLNGHLLIRSGQGDQCRFWRCVSGLLNVLVNRKMVLVNRMMVLVNRMMLPGRRTGLKISY